MLRSVRSGSGSSNESGLSLGRHRLRGRRLDNPRAALEYAEPDLQVDYGLHHARVRLLALLQLEALAFSVGSFSHVRTCSLFVSTRYISAKKDTVPGLHYWAHDLEKVK